MEQEEPEKEDLMLEQPETFRVNKDTLKKIEWLLRYRANKYENKSHLFRCAIIKLFNEEQDAV
jgi:hypothetical protein